MNGSLETFKLPGSGSPAFLGSVSHQAHKGLGHLRKTLTHPLQRRVWQHAVTNISPGPNTVEHVAQAYEPTDVRGYSGENLATIPRSRRSSFADRSSGKSTQVFSGKSLGRSFDGQTGFKHRWFAGSFFLASGFKNLVRRAFLEKTRQQHVVRTTLSFGRNGTFQYEQEKSSFGTPSSASWRSKHVFDFGLEEEVLKWSPLAPHSSVDASRFPVVSSSALSPVWRISFPAATDRPSRRSSVHVRRH